MQATQGIFSRHPDYISRLKGVATAALFLILTGCGGNDSNNNPAAGNDSGGQTDTAEPTNSFTLAVLPDTQKYSRYTPERFDAQTQWIADNYADQKIVFTMHLGDVVDLADQNQEWTEAVEAMSILDQNPQTPYSILAGNHDVLNWSLYDTERDLSAEPFLKHFSAEKQSDRFTTFQGTDNTGFGSYHIFQGEERQYMVLALDWRTSYATLDWAQSVLDAHPDMPVILTTHQLLDIGANTEDGNQAIFTDHGLRLWSQLVYENDQIFMTINGHHHGEASMIARNQYGRDVIMQLVDYQSGYWGGNGMMQLITFDKPNKQLRLRSFSPWVAAIPQDQRGPEDELERWVHSIPLDFDQRFSNLNQGVVAGSAGNIEGTLAYWVLDKDHLVTGNNGNPAFVDASGNGNTMTLTPLNGATAQIDDYFQVSDESAPFGHANGLANFNPAPGNQGYYLYSDAPSLIFEQAASGQGGYLPQYTIEAIVRLPADWNAAENDWAGILNHQRSIWEICNFHAMPCSGNDASVGLNVSSLAEFQWGTVSQNGKQEDSWSWEVEKERWYHVALVNDGEHLRMYVNGQQTMRSGTAIKEGLLAAPGRPWTIGANRSNTNPSNLFDGDIAEIRINSRVLEPSEWLYSQ